MRATYLIAGIVLILAIVMVLPAAAAAQAGMDADDKSGGVVFLPYSADLVNSTGAPEKLGTDAKTWHHVNTFSHYMTGTGDVKKWAMSYANRAGNTRIIMNSPLGTFFTMYVWYRGKWFKSPTPGNYAIAFMYMVKGEPYRLKVRSNSGSGPVTIDTWRKY